MLVLGIESSCDETGVGLYSDEQGLIAHTLYSQVDLHLRYGGVVPELASRDHIQKLQPLVHALLDKTATKLTALDGIAYTAGPGLSGALLVGAAFARSLAYSLNKPCVGVHHLEAHLLSPMLEENAPSLPFLALLVSGGHTMLIKVAALGQYEILGESLDDAAGEAFDKTAKIMGLPYPGGPILAKLADEGKSGMFHLPRPMVNRANLDFSFSGLKTAVAELVQKHRPLTETVKANIACEFQEAVMESLFVKTKRALQQTGLKTLVVAGGVSANKRLRHLLQQELMKLGGQVYFPRHEFCTDNGAMIALTGCLRLVAGQYDDLGFGVRARWPLDMLKKI